MMLPDRLNPPRAPWLPLALLLLLWLAAFCPAQNPHGLPDGLYSEITTERGVIVAQLFYEQTPLTVASHVGLAEGTLGPKPRKPFYDGSTWHRVVPGFVLQGGDPSGTGEGDAGYQFPDEIVPGLRHDGAGTLQMANDGPDTNGSQFCFMLSEQPRLNYLHTVFGRVVRGLEVLPKIQQGDTMRVKILRLGAAAKAFRADEEAFNALLAKANRYKGPREPGPDAPFDDPDHLLPAEWDRAKNFNYKLANFERFTGARLAARVLATRPAAAEGEKADAWMQAEAARLGVEKRGALAVHFASESRWQIRIGDETAKSFVRNGPTGIPTPSAPAPSVASALDAMMQVAMLNASKTLTAATKALGPDEQLSGPRRLKLKVDSVLDLLIFKLEEH